MRLAAHVANGCNSLIRPSSGKDTANDKGVHREVESEGSRKANLWSDEQKPHEAIVKDKAAKQVKVQKLLGINYSRCGRYMERK